jgi:putative ABC transport system permease protein
MRSLLTMLGVIIGVGAVISMLAIVEGAKQQIMSRITAMGTNLLLVMPNWQRGGGTSVRTNPALSLKLADAEAILREVTGIRRLAPVVQNRQQVKYFNQNDSVNIIGTAATYMAIRSFEVEKGRCFTEAEVESGARVCVLGPETVESLIGRDDPLTAIIKIKSINFRVIGVLKAKGDQGWFNPDNTIYMPYTVAMNELFGVDHLREIDIQATEGEDLVRIQKDITVLMRRQHRLLSDQEDDFRVLNQAEWIEMANETTRRFSFLLGGIASISLLVGGIGIMNIMLVTVTERTREIGVRKAIGAKERSILLQFLLEALIISTLGGLIGAGLGVGGAYALTKFTPFTTAVSPFSIVLSLSFAGIIGVFFGFYPARRAASLDPVEALRYE